MELREIILWDRFWELCVNGAETPTVRRTTRHVFSRVTAGVPHWDRAGIYPPTYIPTYLGSYRVRARVGQGKGVKARGTRQEHARLGRERERVCV